MTSLMNPLVLCPELKNVEAVMDWSALGDTDRQKWRTWLEREVRRGGVLWVDSGDGADLRNYCFDGFDLSGLKLGQVRFDGSSFKSAILDGLEARRARFRRCRMVEASIVGAVLDEADFRWARIDGATFRQSKLQKANFQVVGERVILKRASLERAYLAGARIRASDFTGANFNSAQLPGVDFRNGVLDQVRAIDANFERGHFAGCQVRGGVFNRARLGEANFENSRFIDCNFAGSKFLGARMRGVYFDGGSLNGVDFSDADLSHARLQAIDLHDVRLSSAVMLGSAFNRCLWPAFKVSSNILGTLEPDPRLLQQPVQDILGVPPLVRDEIATAQFLKDLRAYASSSLAGRIAFRLWGMTSGYGLSLSRWLFWCTVIIFAFAGLRFYFGEQIMIGWASSLRLIWESSLLFFSLGDLSLQSEVEVLEVIGVLEIAVGYFMLGGLVSILGARILRASRL